MPNVTSLPACAAGSAASDRRLKGRHVANHVIGRQHQQQRIGIRLQRGQRNGRRRVATHRFQHDGLRLDALRPQLLSHEKPMRLVAHDDRRRGLEPLEPRARSPAASCCSPTSGSSCLGYSSRDSGHSRVPEPPERTTGVSMRTASYASPRPTP